MISLLFKFIMSCTTEHLHIRRLVRTMVTVLREMNCLFDHNLSWELAVNMENAERLQMYRDSYNLLSLCDPRQAEYRKKFLDLRLHMFGPTRLMKANAARAHKLVSFLKKFLPGARLELATSRWIYRSPASSASALPTVLPRQT